MVYRRRVYRRKRITRKRAYRKRFNKRTRYSKRGQKLYLYKRFVGLGTISVSNSIPTYGSYDFSLNDLPNYSELQSLYDMYKINCVKLTFLPQQTQSISIGSINNPNASARFFSVIDYNDNGTPTSVNELRQYQSCKFTSILRPHKRVIFKPRIQDNGQTYSPGSPWVNTSAADQNYFGLKYAIEAMESTTTTSMEYTVEAKYYLSFKCVK